MGMYPSVPFSPLPPLVLGDGAQAPWPLFLAMMLCGYRSHCLPPCASGGRCEVWAAEDLWWQAAGTPGLLAQPVWEVKGSVYF
jgi:hypothetical protein